jgi:hypothetical protein
MVINASRDGLRSAIRPRSAPGSGRIILGDVARVTSSRRTRAPQPQECSGGERGQACGLGGTSTSPPARVARRLGGERSTG